MGLEQHTCQGGFENSVLSQSQENGDEDVDGPRGSWNSRFILVAISRNRETSSFLSGPVGADRKEWALQEKKALGPREKGHTEEVRGRASSHIQVFGEKQAPLSKERLLETGCTRQ